MKKTLLKKGLILIGISLQKWENELKYLLINRLNSDAYWSANADDS